VQTAAVYNILDYTLHRGRDSNPKGLFNEKQQLSSLDCNLRRHEMLQLYIQIIVPF